MPKRRNDQVKRLVLDAAWDLFLERGYRAASYNDLAERSGVSRPLVQYYFPKKALLAQACMMAVRDASRAVASSLGDGDESGIVNAYLAMQLTLATFLLPDGAQRFALDVLYDRDLSQFGVLAVGDLFLRTACGRLEDDDRIPDGVAMAIGGLDELIFQYLKRGEVLDLSRALVPCMLSLAWHIGLVDAEHSDVALSETLAPYAKSNDELKELAGLVQARARASLACGDTLHEGRAR